MAAQWLRIGCIGCGGPPAHIALLRRLCVGRCWLSEEEFEHGIAATTTLLPGPASTRLAILCAWRHRRGAGAVVGGLAFIVPGLVVILALSALFLGGNPPMWAKGAATGAGAAVAAVAVQAAVGLLPASWRSAGPRAGARGRWAANLVLGGFAAATIGPLVVLVPAGCGPLEVVSRRAAPLPPPGTPLLAPPALAVAAALVGGLGAVGWVAFTVGALSFGGGFVIIPLMQADAVHHYHWMTNTQFLNAVALGQMTPGPDVQTVSAVVYAAHRLVGGLVAAVVAFSPSFVFVLVGAPSFDRLRANTGVQAFLTGAGPAAIGAIGGSAIPLGLALAHVWQIAVLAGAAVWLLAARRSVVSALLLAGATGVVVALAGLPVVGCLIVRERLFLLGLGPPGTDRTDG